MQNIPMYPRGKVIHRETELISSIVKPLISLEIIAGALRTFLSAPVRAIKCLCWLFSSRSPLTFFKNIVAFPKALWLADYIRRTGFDHIHVHWAATSATLGLIAGDICRLPWSFTAHRGDIVLNNLVPLKLAKAAFVRCISVRSKSMIESLSGETGSEKLKIIHLGVPLPNLPPQNRQTQRSNVILCPAKFIPVKGHQYLLAAAKLLADGGTDFELWLAGQGELQGQLEEQVISLGLGSRVKFLGQVSHEMLMGYYEQGIVTVTVLASIDLGNGEHEGIPVTLMEAMAYGVPVIATSTGGISELLSGNGGILVPPQDPQSLAGAIAQVLDKPDVWLLLSKAGREIIERDFNVETTVSQLAKLMKEER